MLIKKGSFSSLFFLVHNHLGSPDKMPLLGNKIRYKIRMKDDFENVIIDYVLACDDEAAAWEASQLSSRRNLTLVDVYPDE